MPRRREEEEYCEDCGQLIDECECDDEGDITIDDVNKGLDVVKKGLDVLDKLKKLSTPPTPQVQPRPLSDDEARWIAQDMARKQRMKEAEEKRKPGEEKKKHKKWVIETIIKIAVPIVVALIGVGFYFWKA